MSLPLVTRISVATTCITIFLQGIVLFFSSQEYFKRWRKVPSLSSPNRIALQLARRSVLMIVLASLFSVISGLGFLWSNLIGAIPINPIVPPSLCTAVLPKMYTMAYTFVQMCLCEFLRVRSLLVPSPRDSTLLFRGLRFFATNSFRIGGIAFQIAFIIYWGGVIVEVDGISYCVNSSNWVFFVAFAVSAFPTQCAFTFLFIAPLWQHANEMKNMGSPVTIAASETIVRVIHRNLFLSSTSTLSTMFGMIFMAVVANSYQDEPALLTASLCYGNIDLLINLACMCTMTFQWLPPHLRPRAREQLQASIMISHTLPDGTPIQVKHPIMGELSQSFNEMKLAKDAQETQP